MIIEFTFAVYRAHSWRSVSFSSSTIIFFRFYFFSFFSFLFHRNRKQLFGYREWISAWLLFLLSNPIQTNIYTQISQREAKRTHHHSHSHSFAHSSERAKDKKNALQFAQIFNFSRKMFSHRRPLHLFCLNFFPHSTRRKHPFAFLLSGKTSNIFHPTHVRNHKRQMHQQPHTMSRIQQKKNRFRLQKVQTSNLLPILGHDYLFRHEQFSRLI